MSIIYLILVFCLVSNNCFAFNASVFCDKRTATGSMNCNAMQFAHKYLPLGSIHTLCSSSHCIKAKVVDRGPYVRGRVFDLSPGLARALGVNGLGNVKLR